MSYRKGARREYQVIEALTRLGYRCVRSAGSHGVIDVVAVGSDAVLLIQVGKKRTKNKQDVRGLEEYPCPPSCRVELWTWSKEASGKIAWAVTVIRENMTAHLVTHGQPKPD